MKAGILLLLFFQLCWMIALFGIMREVRLNGEAIEKIRKLQVKMFYEGPGACSPAPKSASYEQMAGRIARKS